jgi:biopolymer transport protein ExbD
VAVSTSESEEEVMSTINITPFTDVLLVLLIIFIILAAITKEPPLPIAKNKIQVTASQIVVVIDAKNKIQVGSDIVDEAGASKAFEHLAEVTGHRLKTIIIKADPKTSFGTIIRVMDAAKNADLTGFGLANKVEGSKD